MQHTPHGREDAPCMCDACIEERAAGELIRLQRFVDYERDKWGSRHPYFLRGVLPFARKRGLRC